MKMKSKKCIISIRVRHSGFWGWFFGFEEYRCQVKNHLPVIILTRCMSAITEEFDDEIIETKKKEEIE